MTISEYIDYLSDIYQSSGDMKKYVNLEALVNGNISMLDKRIMLRQSVLDDILAELYNKCHLH